MPGKIFSAPVCSIQALLTNNIFYRTTISAFSLFIVIALFSIAHAENIKNLYDSRVLVPQSSHAEDSENSEKVQRQLIEKAFIDVLYKVTGSRAFLAIEDSQKLLANAENLVQKFGYENLTKASKPQKNEASGSHVTLPEDTSSSSGTSSINSTSGDDAFNPDKPANDVQVKSSQDTNTGNSQNSPEVAAEAEPEQPQQKVFWVRFNRQATDQLLKEYGLPVWDSLRPDTLIWLSIEENRQRNILTPAISPKPFKTIQEQAGKRGIPLKIPFGDLEDKNRLTIADLWGNFSNAILAASQRYHTQAVLAVRVFQEPSGLWIGNWSLYILGENANWQIRNENLNVLLARGIDKLANNLAGRFAIQVADDQQNKLLIQINNVVDFEGYARVKKYFSKLPAIKSSSLVATYGDSLLYEIEYLSNENHLLQTLNLGNVLQKVESSKEEGDDEPSEYTPVILDDTGSEKAPQAVPSNNSSSQKIATEGVDSKSSPNPADANIKQNKRTELENSERGESVVEEQKVPLPSPEVEYWLVN